MIIYMETPYVYKHHIEVWYDSPTTAAVRIGSVNGFLDDPPEGFKEVCSEYSWSFLSYPNSNTSFHTSSLSEMKDQIELHRDALYVESQQSISP